MAVARLDERLADDRAEHRRRRGGGDQRGQRRHLPRLDRRPRPGRHGHHDHRASRSSTDPHDGEAFAVANVGDSRGYVLRHGRLRQVTIDHSFVQELVAEGAITRDEARTHPRRNIVTRALGIEPYVRVDSWTMPIIRGDRFVLCSDGLVDEVPTTRSSSRSLKDHPDDPERRGPGPRRRRQRGRRARQHHRRRRRRARGRRPARPDRGVRRIVPAWNDDELDITGESEIVTDPLELTIRRRRRGDGRRRHAPDRVAVAGADAAPTHRPPRHAEPAGAPTPQATSRLGRLARFAARARRARRAGARLRDLRGVGPQRLLRRLRRPRSGRRSTRAARRRAVVRPDARGLRASYTATNSTSGRSRSSSRRSSFESRPRRARSSRTTDADDHDHDHHDARRRPPRLDQDASHTTTTTGPGG